MLGGLSPFKSPSTLEDLACMQGGGGWGRRGWGEGGGRAGGRVINSMSQILGGKHMSQIYGATLPIGIE
jgi:hypothetical protein